MAALLHLESRANLQELVLTQSEARALVAVAQELQGQGHADVAGRLLSGTLVRFKKQRVYRLAPVASLRLPPDAPAPTLVVPGYAELTLELLSSTNPFTSDAAYEATGQQEAARLAAAAAAAGGLDLWQAAAAVWRKKVAQGWAPQLQQLMAMHGIGRLLHDLEDAAMIEAVADNLEPLPPAAPAAPLPAHQQPHAEQPVGQPEPQPAADHALAPVPAAEPELPPHVLPPQPPPAQQAVVAHDPDDLPPHLRPQPQRAAQQPMQQPALPAQQQAALQQVEQQWPHQLWPVVQRQPLPLPPLAQQREQQAAEAEAPTPVLSSLSDAAMAAWDAAMAAEAQPSSAHQAGAAQPAELHEAAPAQQAEVQQVAAPGQQPPTDQLEEAQSLLLSLLEQQQQQQEVPPPPPPPQQQPAEPLQEAEGWLPPLPPPPPAQPPVKEEPQQPAEPLAKPAVSQQPAGQQPAQREPVNGQLPMAAVQHEQGHPAEQQARALPRSVSEPLQRHPPGGVGVPPAMPRSISERPRAQQLPPGLRQGPPYPQQLPPGLQQAPPHAQQLPPGLQPKREQVPPASSDAQQPQVQQQVQVQQQMQQHQQPQQQEWSVLVANLGDAFTVEQLETYFRQRYPSVTSAAIPRIERTGEPKGFGFVRFARREEQLRAAREMDGHVLPGGRKIGTGLAGTAGGPVQPAPTPAAVPAPASAGTGTGKQQAAQAPAAAVLPAAAAAVQQEEACSPERQLQRQHQPLQQPQQPQHPGQTEQLCRSASGDKSPPVHTGVPTTADAAAAAGRASNMVGPAAAGAAAPAGPVAGAFPPTAAVARQPAPLGRQQSFPAAVPGAWQPSFPAAGVGGPLGRQPSFPSAVAGSAFERQPSFLPALAAAGAAQAMVPMMWPAGAFGAAGFMPVMLPGNRLGYTAVRPGMPGMPAVLGQSMHPGMTTMPAGGLAMPAGGGRALGGMAAQPLPPPPAPAQPLQHLGSGHSSADVFNLEAAGRQSNGPEAVQHSGSGRSGKRSRSRSRSRNRSRSRSRSPRSGNDRRRRGSPSRRSRSRSRSPMRDSGRRSGPAAASPGRSGPVLPLWLPPLLKAACKSVAFDSGVPFPAIRLLPVLDDLRGERDCLYRAGSNLRHVCDFLQFTRTADVELRPDGPLIVRLR